MKKNEDYHKIPWIKIHKNALTKDECKSILDFCDTRYKHLDLLSGDQLHRTSNSYFIPAGESVDNKIKEFTANVTELPIENQEQTSIVRYKKGQEYKAHDDYFHPNTKEYDEFVYRPGNTNRVMTSLFYLNDEFEGGETYFPYLDLTIKPELGMCITWVNMLERDMPNTQSRHAGLPVISGVKHIATKWIHFTPYIMRRKLEGWPVWNYSK